VKNDSNKSSRGREKIYLKLSWQISVLKFSQTISHVIVELKTNVSEISSVSIIRGNVVNKSGYWIKSHGTEILANTSGYMG
jgi:hypothetical protein